MKYGPKNVLLKNENPNINPKEARYFLQISVPLFIGFNTKKSMAT